MKKTAKAPLSRKASLRRVGWLFALFLVLGGITWPQGTNWLVDRFNGVARTEVPHVSFPWSLGLDLQGGTRLEYAADLSHVLAAEQQAAMEGVRDVIERRVNALGVSEPIVQTAQAGNQWRLAVELAGIRDVNEAIRMIGETPILDFREENTEAGRALTVEEQAQLDAMNAEIRAKADAALTAVKAGKSLSEVATAESNDATSQGNGGDAGFLLAQQAYAGVYSALRDAPVGLHSAVIDDGARWVVADVLERKDAGVERRASHIAVQWAGAEQSMSTSTKEEALARITEIASRTTAENFDDIARTSSDEPGADQTAGDLGWFRPGEMVESFADATAKLEMGAVSGVVETSFGYHLIKKTGERPLPDVRVRLVAYRKAQSADIVDTSPWKRTALTGKQLARAQLNFDPQTSEPMVTLDFDGEGADLFAELTKKNIGKPIGIFLDDQPISVPVVNQEILGGQAVISGGFTVEEAKLLAQRLQAGALPVPIEIISQQTVGPTLGSESIAASLNVALFGFAFVALFMLLLYRIPGLVAVVALAFYTALLIALFKLIPVTLTLSGIAGLILSIGMAVDANVLIFERFKEELRAKKPMSVAIEEAFKRAWLSIRDGNATTLISCAVLYWFSSSVIKGFALTLALGVFVSLFSATVVTHALLRVVAHPALVARFPRLFLMPKA
ncbi:MAG: hypothetical protein RL141_112 [Candidatus Parcubacteria bacterium]|jgi:protein-export membrane protein SecD